MGLLVVAGLFWDAAPGKIATTIPTSPSPATQCSSCHAEQFREWSQSFHARSLTSEGFLRTFPQYLDFVGKEAQEDPATAMACFNCHAPLLRNASPQVIRQVTDLVLAKDIEKLDGFEVGCVSCHGEGDRLFSGPIRKPKDNPYHASKFSTAFKEASFCAVCHTWAPASIPCSDVYSDWKMSKAAKQGKTCQSCHMPERSGMVAVGGPMARIHSHSFPGAQSTASLQQAVALRLKAAFRKERLEVTTTVRNLVPHRVPDG
jgi:hypothetical protein